MDITSGKQKRAVKAVIYGAEGIGKSTLAAQFPKPLFIDLENGSSQLEVDRITGITTWQEMYDAIAVFEKTGKYETLVIDTADKADALCAEAVCADHSKKGAGQIKGIEDFGYGKGYTYLAEEFQKFLKYLDLFIANGYNVVIVAHAKMRKFEQPDEMGAYDRWELKLMKTTAPLLKEWCDLLLFCNYKTRVMTPKEGSKKATGGERVMYASHHPCWDAKNRFGLPDEMPLSFEPLKGLFTAKPKPTAETAKPATQPQPETPIRKLRKMMDFDGIDDLAVLAAIEQQRWASFDDFKALEDMPGKVINSVIKYWDRIKEMNKNE